MGPPNEKASKFAPTSRIKKLLQKRLHILQWLPNYTKNDILADFIAGLTVGLTMMPQSIAYAGLAGISPEYGLYTAFIGSFTYVFFGTIKEVSIGPTSLMSLLTFSFVFPHPVEYVILLTFIAGCVEFTMGVLKLGFLVDFISPCLTSGFTSASAIIIIVAQLKHLLGIKLHSHDTFEVIVELSNHIGEIKWQDTLLGVTCILSLFCFKQLTKIPTRSPSVKKLLWFLSISKNALIVLMTSLFGAYLYYNGGAPFKLTGPVPKGMPEVGFPALSAKVGNETVGYREMVKSLGSGTIVIPVVAVLANVAIAKSYSADVVVDASQEMMTLGLCNIFGSFVKAMPSCGAFTRSAVASSSDVRTPLQGIYSGSVIILALTVLAPYFFFIPKATLAAVLITAGSSLIDYEIFPVLWKCNKVDFILTLMTFVIGVVKGVEAAIVIGSIFNAMILLKAWSRPNILVEIRTTKENNREFVYVKPELGLYYPAADYVSETVKKAHNRSPKLPIVVDCVNIIKVDYSAAKMLENLLNSYNEREITLCLINVTSDILQTLKTVTDTSYLQLCKSTSSIPEKTLNFYNTEHEVPLLKGSRKSSVISERRVSIYDLE
ncbi:sodium-independent sulfate anion transporter [Anoplophora glabripennis]|uniref:sodium-independent sulfate anion transporter n=1 Tax=Anoplophora glabripennis TaxID=217634 RepID=UPI000875A09F|nr:sodium-independent sulfate anion transporter [Anoplophora glabripennis]